VRWVLHRGSSPHTLAPRSPGKCETRAHLCPPVGHACSQHGPPWPILALLTSAVLHIFHHGGDQGTGGAWRLLASSGQQDGLTRDLLVDQAGHAGRLAFPDSSWWPCRAAKVRDSKRSCWRRRQAQFCMLRKVPV